MAEQKPPQEVAYIIRVTGVEEYKLRSEPPRRRDFFAWLFNTKVASGAMTGGRYTKTVAEQGIFDHSTIREVLEKIDELRARQQQHMEEYAATTERKRGFEYTGGICAELWVGASGKLALQPSDTQKIYPGAVWHFQNAEISATNLQAALNFCDSAESRALKAARLKAAIDGAFAPAKNPKLMKPLNFKK